MYGMYLMMASPRMACRPVLACEEEFYTDSMRTDLFTIGDEPVLIGFYCVTGTCYWGKGISVGIRWGQVSWT